MRSIVRARWLTACAPALASLALCGSATEAAAQPDELHGYVEPCTLGNVQETDLDCELCAALPTGPAACGDRLSKRGFQKKCRTRGNAAAWDEVWCADRKAASAKPRAGSNLPTVLGISALLAAALGAFFVMRRRSKPAATK